MRSAGRGPSTERVRIEAKRTLDALGTTPCSPAGGRRSKRSAARPAPLTAGYHMIWRWQRNASLLICARQAQGDNDGKASRES
jgi:hypothetical protein